MEHGLVDRKGNYDFMFSINTRSRIYFLAVDSQKEMDTWVSMVCKACGLKDTSEVEPNSEISPNRSSPVLTPPGSTKPKPLYVNTSEFNLVASSSAGSQKPSISSPYIHISECFSGKPEPPLPPPRHRSTDSYRHNSSNDDEQVSFMN